jgi:uncharacterized membrane protein YozB (DUF420 family)
MTSAYRALKAAFRAFARMPLLACTTFILLSSLGIFSRIVAEWLGAPFPPILPQDGTGHLREVQDKFILAHSAITLLSNVIRAFFIAPLALSIHRFVLMEVARDKIALDLSLSDIRFGVWVAVTSGATELLADGPAMLSFRGATSTIYSLLLPIALILVAPRISLVFPLLAAEAPRPLRTSWTLTKHHVARIASVTCTLGVCSFVLGVAIYLPCRVVLHQAARSGWVQLDTAITPVVVVCVAALSTIFAGGLAAMASNFLLEYRKPMAE